MKLTIKSLFPTKNISSLLAPSDYKIWEKLVSHAKTFGNLKSNHEYSISLDELFRVNNITDKTYIKLVLMRIVELSIHCDTEHYDGKTGQGVFSVIGSVNIQGDTVVYRFTDFYVNNNFDGETSV